MRFMTVHDTTIHFAVSEGPTNAPLVVLVNSLGCDLRIWDELVVYLPSDMATLRYDKRGHGLSGAGRPPYSMEDHVADLVAIIEAFSASKTIVCGLSIGGMIAQGLALARPDLIDGIILSDTTSRIGSHDRYNARIEDIRANGMVPFAENQVVRWFSDAFRAARPETVDGMFNMLVRQDTQGYLGSCVAIRDADYSEIVGNITIPTLCLVGEKDASTTPQQVRELADSIPGAAFEQIAGAGHLPCVEKPKQMASVIGRFVAGLTS